MIFWREEGWGLKGKRVYPRICPQSATGRLWGEVFEVRTGFFIERVFFHRRRKGKSVGSTQAIGRTRGVSVNGVFDDLRN
jgi:hypothetical protein